MLGWVLTISLKLAPGRVLVGWLVVGIVILRLTQFNCNCNCQLELSLAKMSFCEEYKK